MTIEEEFLNFCLERHHVFLDHLLRIHGYSLVMADLSYIEKFIGEGLLRIQPHTEDRVIVLATNKGFNIVNEALSLKLL